LQQQKPGADAIITAYWEKVWSVSAIREFCRCIDLCGSATQCMSVVLATFILLLIKFHS